MSINVCNDRSMASITSLPSGVSGGSLVLLETQTLSSAASTVSFTSNIDSTYKEYQVHYIDVHPEDNNTPFSVNFRPSGGSYSVAKQTTCFTAYHNESDSTTSLEYETSSDLANGVGFQALVGGGGTGNGNDESVSGILQLYDPSSTTFVKHFLSESNHYHNSDYSAVFYVQGYCNTTTAIDAIQFKFADGNIDAGTFKLYGVA